jgi:demethylmenaquinone methyltransferase/2-methoxy-6-polyprenyl-1,4-benzoquinol methylase
MDKGWRNAAARECLAGKPQKVLDLCCGTGDLGLTIARMADYPLEVKGLDYSQPMLDIAAQKAAEVRGRTITFTQGDASKLPFPSASFDCVGVSFAFRNLTYRNVLAKEHIAEILRVLKPGGRCVIAESSQPGPGWIRALDHIYFRLYVYPLGACLSGNKAAYRYLAQSAIHYYSPEEMRSLLVSSGFKSMDYKPLFFGAAGVYSAVK